MKYYIRVAMNEIKHRKQSQQNQKLVFKKMNKLINLNQTDDIQITKTGIKNFTANHNRNNSKDYDNAVNNLCQ